MPNALANLDRARSRLAKATTLDEVKQIRDMAEAARTYAKSAHIGRDKQNKAAEVALLAARKAGAILKKLQKTRPQSAAKAGAIRKKLQQHGPESTAKAAGDSEYGKALKDTNTPERTARYWQKLADVSERIAKQYFVKVRNTEKGEISAAGLLREANSESRIVASITKDPKKRQSAKEDGRLGLYDLQTWDSCSWLSGGGPRSLADQFGAPPFSTLDLKQGYWLERQRAWKALGIADEAGRGDEHRAVHNTNIVNFDSDINISVFNPALTEILYQWFAPKGGRILDPFAGGSARGIVAAFKGHRYTGIELRHGRIEKNLNQVRKIHQDGLRFIDDRDPKWILGDSSDLSTLVAGQEFDLILTCPPYYDLEIYSKTDERDLSRCKTYEDFISRFEYIFSQAVQHLKQNRFVVVVVGEIRDKKTGWYRNFVGDTVSCLQRLGLHYYNEIILIDPIGSAPVRAGIPFSRFRKVVKAHQNVLVFWKGDDDRRIPEALGVLNESESETQQGPEKPFSEGPMFDQLVKESNADKPKLDMPSPRGAATELTPVERRGDYWIKRDDLFSIAGVCGGKARTCWNLAQVAPGLVTAGSRMSPQVNIVAQIAKHLGIPARAHTPNGELSPELLDAQAAGCEIVQHRAGYNNVIIARARADAAARGWREIPFGMECAEAIQQTRGQVRNLPREIKRLVIPVGSGMSLAGVLWGMKDCGLNVPVLGVRVGAEPRKQLVKYAPPDWEKRVKLVDSGSDYHKLADTTRLGDVALDPIYEGKCVPFLKFGDLFWIVGIRRTALTAEWYGEKLDKEEAAAVK